jgi:sugar-specific transcriptional regulator TrmB
MTVLRRTGATAALQGAVSVSDIARVLEEKRGHVAIPHLYVVVRTLVQEGFLEEIAGWPRRFRLTEIGQAYEGSIALYP